MRFTALQSERRLGRALNARSLRHAQRSHVQAGLARSLRGGLVTRSTAKLTLRGSGWRPKVSISAAGYARANKFSGGSRRPGRGQRRDSHGRFA
jgi:hypothetical protein